VALLPVHGFGCQGIAVATRGAAAALVARACPCFAYLPACLPAVAVRGAARQPRAAAPPRARAMLASASPARAVVVVMSAAPLGFDSVGACVAAHVAPLPGGTPAAAVPCVARCGRAATEVAFLISIDWIGYALGLAEDSYLRMHVEDTAFSTDSQWGAQGRKRKAKRYDSGSRKRKRWGLTGNAFMQHKYGADVDENRAANLAKRSRAHS
jgi:hypothetical protein